jgi:hypothetical protein
MRRTLFLGVFKYDKVAEFCTRRYMEVFKPHAQTAHRGVRELKQVRRPVIYHRPRV